jgi:HEAT repeat protein
MKLENLLANLNNPQPSVRIDVARVLSMVEETRALKAIGDRYRAETDAQVRGVLAWAGKQLYAAQQNGYSTLDEVFRMFNVQAEIDNMSSEAESELLRQLQDNLDADLARQQQDAARRRMGGAVAMGLAGAMLGGASMGASMMMDAAMQQGGNASSNLGQRPRVGQQRAPATMPTQADLSVWVKRLRESPGAADREKATVELASLNNPGALPFLASAFMSDPSPQVQAAAQRAGKRLYCSALYWYMDQDGSLTQEIQRRAAAQGQPVPTSPEQSDQPPARSDAPPPDRPKEDINAILKAAQAGRKRRKNHR